MATTIFVNWSDGLGGRAFDHHRRNGGQEICQSEKFARRAGHLTNFFKSPGFVQGFAWGGMLMVGIDSHITITKL